MDPANLRGRDVGPKLGVGGGDDAPLRPCLVRCLSLGPYMIKPASGVESRRWRARCRDRQRAGRFISRQWRRQPSHFGVPAVEAPRSGRGKRRVAGTD